MGEGSKSRVFVTDLDGTLFRSDATVSDFTVGVLNRLIEEGNRVTYSTARSYYLTSRMLSGIRFTIPVIVHNGVYMMDPQTGSTLVANLLHPEVAEELLAEGATWGQIPFVFGEQDGQEVLYHVTPQNEGQLQFLSHREGDKRLRLVDSIHLPEQVINLNYIATEEQLVPLKEWAEQRFGNQVQIQFAEDRYLPGFYMLQFYHPDADKGVMIKKLAEHLDVSLSQMTVFGDHLNDLGMFEAAGHRVAVRNAHPTVLELAHEVIEDNEQDGVARYLEGVCVGRT